MKHEKYQGSDRHCRVSCKYGMHSPEPCSAFLEYSLWDKDGLGGPPESYYLCAVHEPLYTHDGASWIIKSIAPIPNAGFIGESAKVCQIWENEQDKSSGGFGDWGECSTKHATHAYSYYYKNGEKLAYACGKHKDIWGLPAWQEIPMEQPEVLDTEFLQAYHKHNSPGWNKVCLYKFGKSCGEADLDGTPCSCCGRIWGAHSNTKCIHPALPGYPKSPLSGQYSTGKLIRDKIGMGRDVRTQKARGLKTLHDYSFPVPGFRVYDVEGCEPATLIGKFVRPCPMRPRHGFVDSREVKDQAEAELIIKQTLEADPESEFLIMDYVNAPYSGIWTPGYLAIGLGTDGATAGKTAVTVPVLGDLLADKSSNTLDILKRGDIKNAAYVELLWERQADKYKPLTVQLRDGPKLPDNASEFIPGEIEVKSVVIAEGDLLDWEAKMQHTEPGTVVYHPGGSMASHYAVHAVLNKVPVLITREPKIGETLKPSGDLPPEPNADLMRAGFVLACNLDIPMDKAANFMLLGCHSTTVWLGRHDLLLGAAMGFAWRLTLAAALGEDRHYERGNKEEKVSRDSVYKKIYPKSDTQYSKIKFLQALDRFLNGNQWPSSNYGGYSWYRFTVNAVEMYNALIDKNPVKALEALNQLVHSAHNSGWGFNKFISDDEMTLTAINPIHSGLIVGPWVYQLLTATTATMKTASRSFWKRVPLKIPEDRHTGVGQHKPKKTVDKFGKVHKTSENPEQAGCWCLENPSAQNGGACNGPVIGQFENVKTPGQWHNLCEYHYTLWPHHDETPVHKTLKYRAMPDINKPHKYSEVCTCQLCRQIQYETLLKTKQKVISAQVKIQEEKPDTIHIQYKTDQCDWAYFKVDKPLPPTLKDKIPYMAEKCGKNSYAGSPTIYAPLIKLSTKPGFGLTGDDKIFVTLLETEVTPSEA